MLLWATPAAAHCHIYSVWHYRKPQRCFTALAPPSTRTYHDRTTEKVGKSGAFPERIEILLPSVEFTPCPEGDEKLRGIALLRELTKDR